MSSGDSAQLLAALAQELAVPRSDHATAGAVAAGGLGLIPEADSVSITVRAKRKRYVTLGASDDLANRADELQYRLEQGPCLDVADGHDWYRSGDIGNDDRWPVWGRAVRELGVGSMLSMRLLLHGTPSGALNIYSRRTGAFHDREVVDLAALYATHAAIALTSNLRISGLETALQSRHTIGMAQGILIERHDLDPESAFALLQRYSSVTNTKLAALAADIVGTGALPDLEEQTPPPHPER